jgi:hypothetical protein
MRIFVLTATYELRVSRKSHLRDHPICRLFSRKTTPVCSIILYDDARGKESQILFSEMNATPPASTNTNTNTNNLFPPFPIRYNKIYMIITIINMITLVPS